MSADLRCSIDRHSTCYSACTANLGAPGKGVTVAIGSVVSQFLMVSNDHGLNGIGRDFNIKHTEPTYTLIVVRMRLKRIFKIANSFQPILDSYVFRSAESIGNISRTVALLLMEL
ncbi:hypothetical protein V1477_000103 [Vespula maculifrons]|uniref:Uncharacterized protein n=1 Tax=Vespula maculifrons TaxID=7453 RepID=A0ABD2D2L1_VESMC